MDFTIPCLIFLSPVRASQQLALCSRRGHGKQDIIGPLWAKKMLLKMHRFMGMEHSKTHFSYFKRSVSTSEGSCLVTFKSLRVWSSLLGTHFSNIQLWCLEVCAVTVGNKPHQIGVMSFWCEDPTLNLLWVKYAVSTPNVTLLVSLDGTPSPSAAMCPLFLCSLLHHKESDKFIANKGTTSYNKMFSLQSILTEDKSTS